MKREREIYSRCSLPHGFSCTIQLVLMHSVLGVTLGQHISPTLFLITRYPLGAEAYASPAQLVQGCGSRVRKASLTPVAICPGVFTL